MTVSVFEEQECWWGQGGVIQPGMLSAEAGSISDSFKKDLSEVAQETCSRGEA